MTSKLLLAAAILLAVPMTYAQDAPAPPAGPSAPVVRARGPQAPRAREMRDDNMRDRDHDRDERGGDMRGGFGRLPGGTWWRNPEEVARIGLTAEQQKHIDELFLQNRVQLIHLHASLEEAELLLEPLMNANPVDQPKAMAQIGKIADTRAQLEKTNAKMLLSIRAVLNADQWTKLHDRPRDGREMGPGGPRGPMGRGPGAPPAPPQ